MKASEDLGSHCYDMFFVEVLFIHIGVCIFMEYSQDNNSVLRYYHLMVLPQFFNKCIRKMIHLFFFVLDFSDNTDSNALAFQLITGSKVTVLTSKTSREFPNTNTNMHTLLECFLACSALKTYVYCIMDICLYPDLLS